MPQNATNRLSLGALLLVRLTALGGALEDVLTVLVKLELGDLNFAGGDADGDALAVGLLAGDALDVDNVFEAVASGDLALTTLVAAALDDNLVVLAEGDRADLLIVHVNSRAVRTAEDSFAMHTLYFSLSSVRTVSICP